MSLEIPYVVSKELDELIKVAEITARPLLLKGEPGTGKTLLAHHVSKNLKRPLYEWHIKSTTTAKDGLYVYDAVSRLNDSRFADQENQAKVKDIENYIKYRPMGQSFMSEEAPLLLIDEIDKADIEFPNDLLRELDQMEFSVDETGKTIKAKFRPLTIITSNNEKELPDAFLRRCIFHYIEFPDQDFMKVIVDSHYPEIDKKLLERALSVFYSLREDRELKKRPSTSELIDWLSVLMHQGAKVESTSKIPFLGALLKNEDDYGRYKG